MAFGCVRNQLLGPEPNEKLIQGPTICQPLGRFERNISLFETGGGTGLRRGSRLPLAGIRPSPWAGGFFRHRRMFEYIELKPRR
jgi:hypothetical protein